MEKNFIDNDPNVKDLMEHLDNAGFLGQGQEYKALIEYVSSIEKQLDSLKEQVRDIEDKNNSSSSIAEEVKKLVSDVGERIDEVKTRIITATHFALNSIKEKGFSVFQEGLEFFNAEHKFSEVKNGLKEISENLQKAIQATERSIQKIDAISHEYHEAENHAANIGRIFAGQESSDVVKENGRLAKALKLPYIELQKTMITMDNAVNRAAEKVQSLEDYVIDRKVQAAKKNPVLNDQSILDYLRPAFKDIQKSDTVFTLHLQYNGENSAESGEYVNDLIVREKLEDKLFERFEYKCEKDDDMEEVIGQFCDNHLDEITNSFPGEKTAEAFSNWLDDPEQGGKIMEKFFDQMVKQPMLVSYKGEIGMHPLSDWLAEEQRNLHRETIEADHENNNQSFRGISGNLKAAQGTNVFVLTEKGYNYRAAKGVTDVKAGQCFPEYKNQVPKSWLEKGWVKEAAQETLPNDCPGQTEAATVISNKQPWIDMEP